MIEILLNLDSQKMKGQLTAWDYILQITEYWLSIS